MAARRWGRKAQVADSSAQETCEPKQQHGQDGNLNLESTAAPDNNDDCPRSHHRPEACVPQEADDGDQPLLNQQPEAIVQLKEGDKASHCIRQLGTIGPQDDEKYDGDFYCYHESRSKALPEDDDYDDPHGRREFESTLSPEDDDDDDFQRNRQPTSTIPAQGGDDDDDEGFWDEAPPLAQGGCATSGWAAGSAPNADAQQQVARAVAIEDSVALSAPSIEAQEDLDDEAEPDIPTDGHFEAVSDELELLRAIWPDDSELKVESPPGVCARIVLQLAPRTAGEDLEQFVRCELVMEVPWRYPSDPVRVSLGSSRGLLDTQLVALLTAMSAKADELAGEPALYSLAEAGQELLTELNIPAGECSICLLQLCDSPDESLESEGVARTPCFHTFHASCLADYWLTEWKRQVQERGQENLYRVSFASVVCPECRCALPWAELPQIHNKLNQNNLEFPYAQEANVAGGDQSFDEDSEGGVDMAYTESTEQHLAGEACDFANRQADAGNVAERRGYATMGRRQKRRAAQEAVLPQGNFVWSLEIRNSDTAHACTGGACSVKIVAARGSSDELILKNGCGMKKGEIIQVDAHVATDIGDLIYVELKNTSAETWRPHWLKVHAPDGKESFIFSRQWVAKGRTQKAYADVSGAVGLRALPAPASS